MATQTYQAFWSALGSEVDVNYDDATMLVTNIVAIAGSKGLKITVQGPHGAPQTVTLAAGQQQTWTPKTSVSMLPDPDNANASIQNFTLSCQG